MRQKTVETTRGTRWVVSKRWPLIALAGVAALAATTLVVVADPESPPAPITGIGGDSSPSPPSPPIRTATIAVSGDILVHDTVWESADRLGPRRTLDFAPMLAPLQPALSAADLAICHLETPLAPPGGPFQGYPVFSAPPQVATALASTGYDACSTASNHSVDQGHEGVARTLDVLDAAGLIHTGTARSPEEAAAPVMLDAAGIQVAWLSYTYGTNGIPVDADKPWSVNIIDVKTIRKQARDARAAGADAVILALHWGTEYTHEPTPEQLKIARRLTRSGQLTLIYGHHAHVVQPIRKVNGTWVVFGLGNLLAGQGDTAPGVNDGMIAEFELTQRGNAPATVATKPRYRPTCIDSADPAGEFRVYDIADALTDPSTDEQTRAELLAARRRTYAAVGRP
jgi:hypothetical protein